MVATTKAPLGATTTNRKWYLDVDSSTTPGTPTWLGVFGVTEFKPGNDPTMQDDSDFDSGGWQSETKTADKWTLEFKVRRGTVAGTPTAYDPGQELLRARANESGVANRVHVRWYEMEPDGPRVEAYEGYAAVAWSEEGGGMDALSMVTVTLSGQGQRTAITHPDTP